MTADEKNALIEKWKKFLGLSGWTIRLRDEPLPTSTDALSEIIFATKEAVVWVEDEPGVIHELLHIVLEGLDDCFWRTEHSKALRALWKRRDDQTVRKLEKAFVRATRNA